MVIEKEKEERKKEVEEVKRQLESLKESTKEKEQGGIREVGAVEEGRAEVGERNRRKKCVLLTDSNGRGTTHDAIMNHIPREKRSDYEITVTVAYTLEEASQRIQRGEIDVEGAIIVVDNMTNDVRGTRQRAPATPEQLIMRVRRLQGLLQKASAAVFVQIKPMQQVDVRPYNASLHDYLGGRNDHLSFGCQTQIRMDYLRSDGFHIQPQYDSIIDRTYACAILGMHVPCPTPIDQFVPDSVRRRMEKEWPRVGVTAGQGRARDLMVNHGWRWW